MAKLRWHFQALLSKIEPSAGRRHLAKTLPRDLRTWLKEHDYETVDPHTLLSGSYARHTAILEIPDVDVLLFRPEAALNRKPETEIHGLKQVLDGYPGARASTRKQRRSVRLHFEDHDLYLDIVPVVAKDGTEEALQVPDRDQEDWIASDPLGYAANLSALNQDNSDKVVPLIKLVKAWRSVRLGTRHPKSYVLEVMLFKAVEREDVTLAGKGAAENLTDFFEHLEDKYRDLMDNGTGTPRIYDPQLGNLMTAGWERGDFERFMRRVRNTAKHARAALDGDEDAAKDEWAKVFGDLWPSDDEAKDAARAEAAAVSPGVTSVTRTGGVAGFGIGTAIPSRQTTYHGDQTNPEPKTH